MDDANPFPKRVPEFSRAVDDAEDSDWEDSDSDAEGGAERPPTVGADLSGCGGCALRLGPEARREMAESAGGRLNCATLLVGVGPAACGFLTACVQGGDAQIVGLLSCGFPDSGLVNSLGQVGLADFACFLYRLSCNPQVLLCHASAPVSPVDCHAFVESLLSLVDAESVDVAVLCADSLTAYQSAESPASLAGAPLLRCLRTSAMVGQGRAAAAAAAAVPQLEPPNLLTGLPAQLMSVCQMLRVPAVAYVAYLPSDRRQLDTDTMAAFGPALASEPLRYCRPSWPQDSDRVMRLLCSQARVVSSTLYS